MRHTEPDLERLLRDGPPDEPSILRQLVLPSGRVQPLTGVHRLGPTSPRSLRGLAATAGVAAMGVLAAVLVLGTILSATSPGTGGPRTASPQASGPVASPPQSGPASSPHASGVPASPPPSLAWPSPITIAGSFSVRTPADWHVVQLPAEGSGFPLVALANFDLQARCGVGASAGACIASLRLVTGEIVVTIADDDTARTIAQVASPSGLDAKIDGMPAVLQVVEERPGTQVQGVTAQPGCDAHRAWWIGRPSSPTGWLDIEACSAFADREAFRAAVDGIAQSVVFR